MSDNYNEAGEGPPPVIAGDYADDDATYVDLLLQENPAPTAAELPREEDRGGNVGIAIPNRLFTRTYEFTGVMPYPVLGLPADVNRKSLQVLTDGAYFMVAESGTLLPAPGSSTAVVNPNSGLAALLPASVEIDNYTGPIWFINSGSTGAATKNRIIFIAVTE